MPQNPNTNEESTSPAPSLSSQDATRVSRRHFVGGSATFIGSALLDREAIAQNFGLAPVLSPTTGALHQFSLRFNPVPVRARLATAPFLA